MLKKRPDGELGAEGVDWVNRILKETHIHRHPRTCCGDPCLYPIVLKIRPGFSEKFEEWIPVASTGMTKGKVIVPYAIHLG